MPTVAAKRAREDSSERQEVEKTTLKEKRLSLSETAARAGVVTMVRAEDETGAPQTLTEKRKKKTPKEYRQDGPKIKENPEITAIEKKKFKEMFLTDKSRLDKRQTSFNRPQNLFVLINISLHKVPILFFCGHNFFPEHIYLSLTTYWAKTQIVFKSSS